MGTNTGGRRESLQAALLAAVHQATEAGWNLSTISQASGVPYASLHNWHSGARANLTLATADKLAAHFGMRLTRPTRNVSAPR